MNYVDLLLKCGLFEHLATLVEWTSHVVKFFVWQRGWVTVQSISIQGEFNFCFI